MAASISAASTGVSSVAHLTSSQSVAGAGSCRPALHQCSVDRNARVQPGREGTSAFEARQGRPGVDEGLLRAVSALVLLRVMRTHSPCTRPTWLRYRRSNARWSPLAARAINSSGSESHVFQSEDWMRVGTKGFEFPPGNGPLPVLSCRRTTIWEVRKVEHGVHVDWSCALRRAAHSCGDPGRSPGCVSCTRAACSKRSISTCRPDQGDISGRRWQTAWAIWRTMPRSTEPASPRHRRSTITEACSTPIPARPLPKSS
jgi:hypothetical protein